MEGKETIEQLRRDLDVVTAQGIAFATLVSGLLAALLTERPDSIGRTLQALDKAIKNTPKQKTSLHSQAANVNCLKELRNALQLELESPTH